MNGISVKEVQNTSSRTIIPQ